jgi:gliding motility-associated lipoprotein GldD
MMRNSLVILLLLLSVAGCRHQVSVPKPRGHFRIDLPQHQYTNLDLPAGTSKNIPLEFEYPKYGRLTYSEEKGVDPGWFDIEFPDYKAKIYLTYKDVKNDLDSLLNQSYDLNVKNHVFKADAIKEQVFSNKDNKVYGILYDLKGNTASAVEFYVTDSASHYLRGSLYFAAEPNADSLAPVIDFFREDIMHLIETLRWKTNRKN